MKDKTMRTKRDNKGYYYAISFCLLLYGIGGVLLNHFQFVTHDAFIGFMGTVMLILGIRTIAS